MPEGAAHVGEGIEAQAVEPRCFNPPDGVLNEVLADFAGLAPGDISLVNARMSTANIYSAAIKQRKSRALLTLD
jgi:hypothetical protein